MAGPSKDLRVVVVHRVGRGVVVVLGPFRDKITASQFQSGCGYWGLLKATEARSTKAKNTRPGVRQDNMFLEPCDQRGPEGPKTHRKQCLSRLF